MKKQPLLHPEISYVIASLGVGDRLVIVEANYAIPDDCHRIDLALTSGIPTFIETTRVVLSELSVEEAIFPEELEEASPLLFGEMKVVLGEIPSHPLLDVALRQQAKMAKAFIRTGETAAYAHVLLRAG